MQDEDLLREFDLFVEHLDSCGVALLEDWTQLRALLSAPGPDLQLAEEFLVQLKLKIDAQAKSAAGDSLAVTGPTATPEDPQSDQTSSIDAELSALFCTADRTDQLMFAGESSLGKELADIRSSRKRTSKLANLEVRNGELLEL